MAELSPILAELERLYGTLVTEYEQPLRDNVLRGHVVPDRPIIALASKGRKRTQTGWYNPAVWVDAQEDTLAALAGVDEAERKLVKRAELVIATELLHDPVQTASELLKQVITHYAVNGSNPYAQGAQGYYPEWWSQIGPRFDHIAEVLDEQPSRGWAGWRPLNDQKWREWVRANMRTSKFEVARDSDAPRVKPGSRMKKWRCDCTTIRSATRVVAKCGQCGQSFIWSEKEPPPNDTYNTGQDVPGPDYVRSGQPMPKWVNDLNIKNAVVQAQAMAPGQVYTTGPSGRS